MSLRRILTVGLLAIGVAGCSPSAPPPLTPPPVTPVPVPGAPPAVSLINMIPLALSAESNQDSEPFLAVDPTDDRRLAGTAFTPNPFGPASGNAPIYISTDGGATWALRMTVPSARSTGDITVAGGRPGARLYGGILRLPGYLVMSSLTTDDFLATTPMTEIASRDRVDQPFVQVATGPNPLDRIYIGSNDFDAPGGRTATIDLSLDGGATFTTVRIESRPTAGQDGPSIRPTVARGGTVYVAFFGWRGFNGSIATSDVVVVRDDAGATGATPFRDLTDPADGLPGRRVVRGVTIPWSNAPTLGFERIGSTLTIAVDPDDSDIVYVAWCDRVGTGDIYTVHLRRSLDRGVTWSGDLRTVTDATGISLAIADNGAVGFLYQQFTGGRWVTQLEQSRDGFATARNTVLADVPGNAPAMRFVPYIGDYNFMLASGNRFRGIFSANNDPNPAHFPNGVTYQRRVDAAANALRDLAGNPVAVSIDPFYFTVEAMP